MRMMDILPEHVREWVACMKAGGVKPPTIRYAMVVLSAIFTTALNDQVTSLHPCRGVKTPPVPAQPRTIITPEQFAVLYDCLPDAQSKLLVETAVESGLRWGELTELRVRDIEFATRMLTVSRAVVQVHPRFHPEGGRFLVKPYPKDKEYRRFKLSAQITAKLKAHVTEHGLDRTICCSRHQWRKRRGSGCRVSSPTPTPPGPHRAERGRAPLPARHADRLLPRPLPLRLLPGRLLPLPGRPPRGRQGRPTRRAGA